MSILRLILLVVCLQISSLGSLAGDEFEETIVPFLETHCLRCHGGEKTKGEVDFSDIKSTADARTHFELWETVSFVLEDGEMPPEDEPQPETEETEAFLNWYENGFLTSFEAKPGEFVPRRLSGPEYRNTMRSLFGFDLEVNISEAEQTVVEKSLVLKLLPTDPPGASGYVNDTYTAPISTTIWDQYSYLADFALGQLFSPLRKAELDRLARQAVSNPLTEEEAEIILRNFIPKAFRRTISDQTLDGYVKGIRGKSDADRVKALREEMKAALMSPGFIYRGFLMPANSAADSQPVDHYELAERLSYFLWEDMPDEDLFSAAKAGELENPDIFAAQIDRMLTSPKARSLSESFGLQWLLLDQIKHERNDPPYLHAIKSQPLDFLNYLFTENRPVMELIDSDITFANALTASYYGSDRKQLKKDIKPKGIERMNFPNQKITLMESADERGGILTMPGVLSMNKGPILRGTWMLRQILGEHLGEPPPDVPPIKSSPKGKKLTFRELFEQHRADKSCAICHNKIDPLGFALQAYDDRGGVIGKNLTKQKKGAKPETAEKIDTSGKLPSGETFKNFADLKKIFLTSQRETIIRNAVEQMLAYALCRKLEHFDQPTVDDLTARIVAENGTWRDLIHGIAKSLPFTETIVAKSP